MEVRCRREGRVLNCAEPAERQSRRRWAGKSDWREGALAKRNQKVQPVPQVLESRSGSDVDNPAQWLEARTPWRVSATCPPCPTSRTHSGAFRPDGSRRACRRMRPQMPPERPRNNRSRTARKWPVNAAFLLERSTDRLDRQTTKRKPRFLRPDRVFSKQSRDPLPTNGKLIIYSRLQPVESAKRMALTPPTRDAQAQ